MHDQVHGWCWDSDEGRPAVFTAEERPDFWEHAESSFPLVWPEYNLHGDVAGRYFGALFPQYANVQVLVYDDDVERVVARGKTIPFRWDRTVEDLPAGIDLSEVWGYNLSPLPGTSWLEVDEVQLTP